jgi:hypothetical protein
MIDVSMIAAFPEAAVTRRAGGVEHSSRLTEQARQLAKNGHRGNGAAACAAFAFTYG